MVPGKDKQVGDQVWHYPGRDQCLDCHTKPGGSSLGLSTRQLNSDYAYAEGSMNQIEKFKQLGLFDAPPKDIAGYPDPAGTGTVEERARSYLQANCSICHRPGGQGAGAVDMRFTTAFADSKMCDAVERDTGEVPMYIVVPGKTDMSTLSFRMHDVTDFRMPKIGSSVVDTAGSALIDEWISALPENSCPNQ